VLGQEARVRRLLESRRVVVHVHDGHPHVDSGRKARNARVRGHHDEVVRVGHFVVQRPLQVDRSILGVDVEVLGRVGVVLLDFVRDFLIDA
jgi:hypothetical protein